LGSIPVITWEPWLTDFSSEKIAGIRSVEDRDKGGLIDVANGVYDSYLKEWAANAKRFKHSFFLRFGHEMNDPYRYPWGPQNNQPADYVAAWKHVHDLFKKNGVTNVIWIWSPHPAYGQFQEFYPGNDYVDYVGIGTLNYGTVATWSKWWSFEEIFGKYYPELSGFGKPMMLTEFASLAVGGDRTRWYQEALQHIAKDYPAVKSVLYFHHGEDRTTTQQTLNWQIKKDKSVVKAIEKQLNAWPDSLKPAIESSATSQ